MSETAILGTVAAALWGVVLALLGIVWATLKERLAASEVKVGALERQNTDQETALGRLMERMKAREDAHAMHREDMQEQFTRLESRLGGIEGKIDRLLQSPRTPYPGRYGGDKPPSGG